LLGITVLAVGKLREKGCALLCDEYAKRLSPFCRLRVLEIDEARLPANPSPGDIDHCIAAEENKILERISRRDFVAALCVEGSALSSTQLAQRLHVLSGSYSSVVFAIGGSHGLGDKLKRRANLRLSMSEMTFPHQLARVMLLEQVYRAFAINNHLKYHK